MEESLKASLVSLASGCSFVIGAGIMQIGGVLPFLGACALYFIGYGLMRKYRKMD